jgi:hypothetical protein
MTPKVPHPVFQQPWPAGEFRFFPLGFLGADVIEAAGRWARVHGVGPFHVLPVVEQQLHRHGDVSTASIQVAAAQAGPVQIELIQQHCDRPSVYRDWHRGRVSGLHQLCTVTEDYDGKKAHYESLGHELAGESTGGPFRVGYFDTAADFGFYTEVVEYTPWLGALVERVAQTCATWDGTDPVRLLTRDGYRVPDEVS